MPFKEWLKFHRTTKFYQTEKERENAAQTAPGGSDSEGSGEDAETTNRSNPDVAEGDRKGPSDAGAVGQDAVEKLIGGKGDNRQTSDFRPASIAKGMEVESEHTTDPEIQREITFDHLSVDPKYYDKLQEMENADSDGSETEEDAETQSEDQESEGSENETEPSSTRLDRRCDRSLGVHG